MGRKQMALPVIGALLMGLVGTAHASVMFNTTLNSSTGGIEDWTYEYIVTNDFSVGSDLVDFNVAFPVSAAFFLYDAPTKSGWDVQPVGTGVYNYIAAANPTGIAPGATERGFFVSFTYDNGGFPGALPAPQSFTGTLANNDPVNGSAVPTAVPEPGTYLLLALALPLVAGCRFLMKRFTG